MPWLSQLATRYHRWSRLLWPESGAAVLEDVCTTLNYARVAFESGVRSSEIWTQAGPILTKCQARMLAQGIGAEFPLSASIVRHVCGDDQSEFWSWFADTTTEHDRDADLVAMARRLTDLAGLDAIRHRGKHKRPNSRRGVNALALSTDFEHAVSFLQYEDSPWRACSRRFLLPLALIVSHRKRLDFADVLAVGPYPERRGELFYWRQQAPVDFETALDESKRETWPDFDAIEEKDGRLLVYHYLGYAWQAPLLCVGDVDAFEFLERVDLSWQLVEDTVDAAAWSRIVAARDVGSVEHIFVYDARFAVADPADLERASEKYQLSVTAKDLFKV